MAAQTKPNKTQAAFEAYLSDPVVQKALVILKGTLGEDLLRDAFMHGAKYATARCAEEHHVPKAAPDGK